ncbi:MAG: ABC transporter substrate-binding protein, partial [Nitrosopumilus sp.]|nr:ABC transporter substrate-binding protein [Nitrosopumilus sp.]
MNKIFIFSIIGISLVMLGGFSIYTFQSDYSENVYENTLDFEPVEITLDTSNPIKVGILHSLSGTMAISERSVVD